MGRIDQSHQLVRDGKISAAQAIYIAEEIK